MKTVRVYKVKRNYEQFGAFLAKKRVAAGLTQRAVSLDLGYSSAQFISNFERGIAAPPLLKLQRLTTLYKLNTDEVITRLLKDRKRELVGDLKGE